MLKLVENVLEEASRKEAEGYAALAHEIALRKPYFVVTDIRERHSSWANS